MALPKLPFSRNTLLGAVAALAVIISLSLFTVEERQTALRFQLGEIVEANYEPGLHWKWPLVNNIRKFDRRLQTLDTDPERFLTAEKKNVIVDSFVMWRIEDVRRYYTSVGGDPRQANIRLDQIVKDGLRSEFSRRTIQEVLASDREQIMRILSESLREQAAQLGIAAVDVRIKRIDLPPDVSASVFNRMRAERLRVAMEFRSRGAQEAEGIRADADRQGTVILAEAYRDAERERGEGDAEATRIYAEAFGQNPEFFSFNRSLTAYRQSFKDQKDLLVLQPDSQFFRYFNQASHQEEASEIPVPRAPETTPSPPEIPEVLPEPEPRVPETTPSPPEIPEVLPEPEPRAPETTPSLPEIPEVLPEPGLLEAEPESSDDQALPPD
jgi:modulator of FtsH protease HflC